MIMARDDVDLVPVVDDDGALAGVMTERALARRYVRESREPSRLDAPTAVGAIAAVLEGAQLVGEPDQEIAGRVWVLAMASTSLPLGFEAGDVVVVGDRPDAQRIAHRGRRRAARGDQRDRGRRGVLALARERGTARRRLALDSYVTARMITLSAPCAGADGPPSRSSVRAADLVAEISETSRTSTTGRLSSSTGDRRPIGLVTRSDLVNPEPRPRCSSTTPSRRRAWRASSPPRSSRSSTTTTSARSRRACR